MGCRHNIITEHNTECSILATIQSEAIRLEKYIPLIFLPLVSVFAMVTSAESQKSNSFIQKIGGNME